MLILGTTPKAMLLLAGAFNGLILPVTLLICLIAAKKKSIMGEDYKHPWVLWILGLVVVGISAYMGVTTFINNLGQFFV